MIRMASTEIYETDEKREGHWIQTRMHVVQTKVVDSEMAERMEKLEREQPTAEEMQYMWEQREGWMRLIQPKQEQRADKALIRVAEDEMRVEEEERRHVTSQPSLLIYVIRGQCCRRGGRLSKVSG